MSETAPSNLSHEEEAFLAIEAEGVRVELERFFADPARKRDIEEARPQCTTQVSILSLEDLPRKLQEKSVSLDGATGLWWRERFKRWSDRGPQSNRDKQATWVARWFAREFLREAWKSELLAVTRGHWKQTELYGFGSAQESFKEADRWVKAHLDWSPSKDELENISGTLWWKAHRRYIESGDIYEARQNNPLLNRAVKARDRAQKDFRAAHLATTKGPESEREQARIAADQKGRQLTTLEVSVLFAFHWPAVLSEWLELHAPQKAARAALDDAANGEAKDSLAAMPGAEGRLELAIKELRTDAAKAIKVPSKEGLEALGARNGMFALDAALADFIEGLKHPKSAVTAKEWREKWRNEWGQSESKCRERWADPLRIPRVLARVLWVLKVRPELEREQGRKDAPGIIVPTVTSLVSLAWRGAQPTLFGGKADLIDKRGRVYGHIDGPTIDQAVISLAALGTLNAQRLVRWAICEGYEKRYLRGEADYSVLWIEGGWQAFAKNLGKAAGKAANELRDAAFAMSAIHIDSPTGRGRIFAVHEHKPRPGRPARIEMHLLGPLRPGYVTDELSSLRRAESKRIVPIPMPNKLPPMVGRENEWASQAQIQLLTLRELRTHAEELATNGVVEISERRWRELADEASLPSRLVPEMLGAFVSGNNESPAFLTQPRGWLFNLADAYEVERKAILAAGKMVTDGRAAGRKGAARKGAGLFGGKGGRQK